ncbi:MAG: hypothetical protein JW704_09985 [Anaerolineaceae bacterium]|nr:hypothetical protein [Anaerolineaceae bacterium]
MQNEFIQKYRKTWRVLLKIVREVDINSWLNTGRGTYIPARLALHMLQSTAYYLQRSDITPLVSGKSFVANCWEMAESDLPSQEEIVDYIRMFEERTEDWLNARDLGSKNNAFEWAGDTNAGVILFSFQHFLFHLGELSSLLNESKKGKVEDHFVNA